MSFVFPKSNELHTIEQELQARLAAQRPIFEIMPIRSKDTHIVSFEQKDNYTGLQALRGLAGQPRRVAAKGGNRYTIEPGVYGEFMALDEAELTTRRQWGSFDQPIDLTDLVMEKVEQLQVRFLDRIEYIAWNALKGTFSVSSPDGIVHTDTFAVQTASAAVSWATHATATPLADFRAVALKSRGQSTSFDGRATAWMNRVTFNDLVANTNANDLAGRRTSGLLSVLTLEEINRVMLGEDLPQVRVYDEGYLNDSGTFVPYIADTEVIIVGRRTSGAQIGGYVMTRNVNAPGMAPGQYTKVVDRGETEVPRVIEVHNGHNGAPIIEYPGSIVMFDSTP